MHQVRSSGLQRHPPRGNGTSIFRTKVNIHFYSIISSLCFLLQRFKNQIKQNRTTLLDKIRQSRSNEIRLTLSDWLKNEVDAIEKSDRQNDREK